MSKYCINGTITPRSQNDFESILTDMSGADVALGCFLVAGAIISTVPQHMKMIKTKSAVGLSFLWLFLGNINQYATFINGVALKFPQIQACAKLGLVACTPSLLSLFQLFVFWLFSFPFFCYFLYYTPRDMKKISLENSVEGKRIKKELFYAKILFFIEILFIVISTIITLVIINGSGECSSKTRAFGNGIGMLSVVITFVQWSPQIYKTVKYKSPGSFSILMLCIQGPGTIIILYYLIFISKEYLTTWLSYLCAAVQLFIVLALLIFYWRKDKARQVAEAEQEDDDSSKTDSSISPSGSLLYNDAQPLLKRENETKSKSKSKHKDTSNNSKSIGAGSDNSNSNREEDQVREEDVFSEEFDDDNSNTTNTTNTIISNISSSLIQDDNITNNSIVDDV